MKEEYKDIPNYEGIYQVSNKGNVKNILTKNILKIFVNHQGYAQVTLCKNGKVKLYRVHRLVGESFIENPFNKTQINHIDGNKLNNCSDNLEWCCQSENSKHAYTIGLQKPKKGKYNILSKKVNQYDLEGNLIKAWDCVSEIATKLKIKKQYISACCLNKINKTHGFIFKYEEGLN